MHKIIFKLLLLAVSLMIEGCATPDFKPATHVPSDKALVYLYRESHLYGGPVHEIYANQNPVTRLGSGNYYPYLAVPGDVKFTARQKVSFGLFFTESNMAEITVEAGRTYYLSHDITYGVMAAFKVKYSLKDEKVAVRQMGGCILAECLETNLATQ